MATIIRNEKLFCTCCGGAFALNYPLAVDDYTRKLKLFSDLHQECEQTYIEPIADQSKSVKDKAIWWLANGHVGMSSRTMFDCLMYKINFEIHHPYDPDDFSRCYKLLEAVPEWKLELYKLKPLSKQWSNLVDNWDKLTLMYEQNTKEGWKNSEKIGMYELMKKLIER